MDDLGVPGYLTNIPFMETPYEGMIIELPDSFYSISLMTGPSREHGTSSWENTLAHGWLTRRGTLARCSGLGFQYWKPLWLGDPHGSLILGKPLNGETIWICMFDIPRIQCSAFPWTSVDCCRNSSDYPLTKTIIDHQPACQTHKLVYFHIGQAGLWQCFRLGQGRKYADSYSSIQIYSDMSFFCSDSFPLFWYIFW